MNCINFPTIFTSSKTLLSNGVDAVRNSLVLLFSSDKLSLLGDPYYGCYLRKALFEQNDMILRDLIIDEIYVSILTFIPQVFVDRKNITIIQKNEKIFVEVKYIYTPDNTVDLHTIELTSSTQE